MITRKEYKNYWRPKLLPVHRRDWDAYFRKYERTGEPRPGRVEKSLIEELMKCNERALTGYTWGVILLAVAVVWILSAK